MQQALNILNQYWGYTQFRPGQDAIINDVLQGKDVLAIMSTGAGKSICYQIPGLLLDGTCLVISPLIALMKDQVFGLMRRGISAVALYSGITKFDLQKAYADMEKGKYKFVFISPERAKSKLFRDYIADTKVSLLVVDEAHCISEWGYDFRPPYLHIAELKEFLPDAKLLALTASATAQVRLDILDKLEIKHASQHISSVTRSNLSYSCIKVQSKYDSLLSILKRVEGSALVYCRNRGTTQKVSEFLQLHNFSTSYYHAGLETQKRNKIQEDWISGDIQVVCCTNAFGMGIDKPDVRLVVHFDAPDSIEAYYQEVGRAGRDGKPSFGVLMYAPLDFADIDEKVARKYPSEEVLLQVYDAVCNYLQVAYDEHEGDYFDFNLAESSTAIGIEPILLHNSLKLLEQQQLVQLTDAVFVSSTIKCIASREDLDHIEKYNLRFDRVLKALLRLYAGIFYDAVTVHEQKIAVQAEVDLSEVQAVLPLLHQAQLVDYTIAKDKPQLILLRERLRPYDIHLDTALLKKLRNTYRQRLTDAYTFYLNTAECRSVLLARYFDEEKSVPCNVCNNCSATKKNSLSKTNYIELEQQITTLLQAQNFAVKDLIEQLPQHKHEVIQQVIYNLLEQDAVMFKSNGNLALVNE
jgi:ATP-dependent DNA helicase RecQ